MAASVVVPAYRAAAAIAKTVRAARRIPGVREVVVVDDGSCDDTAGEADRGGADAVIRLPRNRGKGAALRAGVEAAGHDRLLLLDADIGTSAAYAGPLLEAIGDERAMAVAVLPAPAPGQKGGMGLTLALARATTRLLAGFSLAAPMSGQRAAPAPLVRHLGIAPGFGVEVGLNVEAAHLGVPVREVCLPIEHRHTGRTLAGFLHRGRQFRDVLRVLLLTGLGLGWPALGSGPTAARVLVWLLALALVPALGAIAPLPISVQLAAACAAALLLWLPVLWVSAVTLGLRKPNYLGRSVPAASGLLFAVVGTPFLWLMPLDSSVRLAGSVVMVALAAVGLLDDLFAARHRARGLIGHLGALVRGRLTTGAVKAVGGLAAGLVAGVLLHSHQPARVALDALLIALTANLLNLLDLRPGRGLKAFALLCCLSLGLAPERLLVLGPVMAGAVVSAPSDFAGRAMMGDTGSNVLGGTVGLALALTLNTAGCLTAVLFLLAVHLLCERASLTDVIAGSRFLRFLDELGAAHLPGFPEEETSLT